MNAKPLVLGLLVAGLAVAAWFLWRGGGIESVTRPTPPAVDDPVASPDAAQAGLEPGAAADGAVERAAGEPDVAGSRTEAGVAPPETAATVMVRGRLVDGDGEGLAGVELRRAEWRNPDGKEFFGGPGRNGPRHELQTDGEGRFTFELPRDHSAMLELPSADLVYVGNPPMIHGHQGDLDLGDVLVLPAGSVSGVVHDERGNPVEGVTVTAGTGAVAFGVSSSASTGEDGRFRVGKLRPGDWTLRTASAQYLPTEEEVTVEAGAAVDGVVLVVAAGRAIAGQVVDDLGRPVADFRVGAKRTETRGGIEVERFASDEAATTDRNGFFTLAGLAGETATVRAFGPKHGTAIATNVRVGTGNLVLQVDRLATIEGVLRGADGGPLAGSRVRAIPSRDARLAAHGIEGVLQDREASTKTAADGSFRIEGVQPGAVTVAAEGREHLPARRGGIQVAPAQTIRGVQLVAERGAVAHLTVLDENGERIAGAKVSAREPREPERAGGMRVRSRRVEDNEDEVRVFDGDESFGTAVTDGEGVAVIPGLPAKAVAFHAEHGDFANARPITLPMMQNGRVDVELTLRTPGYAELQVTDADGSAARDARYSVQGPLGAPDSENRRGGLDAEGKAVVGPLPRGNYVAALVRKPASRLIGGAMIAWSDDEGQVIAGSERRFEVTPGETTTVEIRRPVLTRVFGTVTGAGGPVAGATVGIEKDSGPDLPGATGAITMAGARSAAAGPDGSFSIADVEAGDYVLRYGRPDQLVKAEARITVPPELPELRHDLVLRTGTVRVQAWSESGDAPIAGAQVELTASVPGGDAPSERRETRVMMVSISSDGESSNDSTMMTIGSERAKTGADGWAEIEDVPAGEYDVRVTHGGHAPGERKLARVVELQTTDVGRVVMTEAGSIRGKVVGPDGAPVRMALVFHRPIDGEEGQPTPAMGGAFTIGALKPGRYVLRGQELGMGPGGGRGPSGSSPEVEVEVEAGKAATAELRLPAK